MNLSNVDLSVVLAQTLDQLGPETACMVEVGSTLVPLGHMRSEQVNGQWVLVFSSQAQPTEEQVQAGIDAGYQLHIQDMQARATG